MRRHFEAMVFCNLADELRTGDVAVAGSEEYADWSEQLLRWDQVEAMLPAYLAEVGLREEGDERPFDAAAFRAQLLTNVLIFHNTLDIAHVVRELQAEG